MSIFQINNHVIGDKKTFIIAEIGQNHQGDVDIAKKMITEAKRIGADCVKFQKSCLTEKFTKAALERAYNSSNSWGETYGKHKEHLEFSIEQYQELNAFTEKVGILFTASAMDIQSLNELYGMNVPVIKIGSGDANNIELLTKSAQNHTPLIISTGMQDEQTVHRIVNIMKTNNKTNYCLLHCVSSYPTEPSNANLKILNRFRELFPDVCLGYSGHEQGIAISIAAVLLGAKVVERHFTLDKQQKGTDHMLSLEPSEFNELISHIRHIETRVDAIAKNDNTIISTITNLMDESYIESVKLSLKPIECKRILECELPCRLKLGKSLVYRTTLKFGTKITERNICAKISEPFGISAERINEFVGRTLCTDVLADETLDEAHFFNSNLTTLSSSTLQYGLKIKNLNE